MHLIRMVQPVSFPDQIKGAAGEINYHGLHIPLYSIRTLLGLSVISPRITDSIIILLSDTYCIALWVEETFIVQDYGNQIDNVLKSGNRTCSIPGIQFLEDGSVLITDILVLIEYCNDPENGLVCDQFSYGSRNKFSKPDPPQSIDFQSENDFTILSDRARILALPEEIPKKTTNIDLLKFQLIYSEYAIDIRYIRESILTREITPVPGAPDHILGIIAVRGEVIPLVDLRVLLNIPDIGLTDLNQVIILTDDVITFGIPADQLTGIVSVPMDQIMRGERLLSPKKSKYVIGVYTGSIIIVDAGEILADPDLIIDDSDERYYAPDLSHS